MLSAAITQSAEGASRKLKQQGDTAKAEQVGVLANNLQGVISANSILDEAEKNPNLTYAIAIKDVRQLLEAWKVRVLSKP